MAQSLLNCVGMSHSRAVSDSNSGRTSHNAAHSRTVEALTAVAAANTPWATFRAITRARELLGDDAEQFWPLIECIAQRQGEVEHLRRLAGTDDLTGVSNRRMFYDNLDRELARRSRTGDPVAVVLVDMDGLKQRNDTLGHASGDEAIRALARACLAEVRTTDIVARLGGDEFGILLAGSDEVGAKAFEARLRAHIEHTKVTGRALLASIGYAVASEQLHSARALMDEADASMYRDKSARKDRDGGDEPTTGQKRRPPGDGAAA